MDDMSSFERGPKRSDRKISDQAEAIFDVSGETRSAFRSRFLKTPFLEMAIRS